MSQLLCDTSCGTPANVPEKYNACIDSFRKFGSKHFVLIGCDVTWTDILDTAEWTTKIGADDLHASPAGILKINEPTVSSFIVEGTGREATGEAEYLIDYETYQTKSDLSDYTYFANIFDNNKSFYIFFLNGSGEWIIQDDWVTEIAGGTPATISTTSPGFEYSISILPAWVEGENGWGKWKMQFKVKKTGIFRAALIPGAEAVLDT